MVFLFLQEIISIYLNTNDLQDSKQTEQSVETEVCFKDTFIVRKGVIYRLSLLQA